MTNQQTALPFGTNLRHIEAVVALLVLSGREAVTEIAPLLHEDLRVLAAPGLAPGRGYQNREEFLAYFSEARASGVFMQPDADEIRLGPTGTVFVEGRVRVSGPAGIDEVPAWFVYGFREGLIASFATYLDRAMAEEAAGLPR